MKIALEEKQQVEKELKELNEMKNGNLIDQYKTDYEQVVQEMKQLDVQFVVGNESSSDVQYVEGNENSLETQ